MGSSNLFTKTRTMKKFVRCMLIGVCFLLGYGWVKASNQVSVETIEAKGCYGAGDEITSKIVEDEFSKFQEADRKSIIGNKDGYDVNHKVLQLEFTGEGITSKKTCNNFDSYICSATSGYRDQIIHCTITYIREIRFKNPKIDESYYDSKKAIQKDDLLGNTETLPQFTLISKRKLPVVIRVKKKLISGETFDIYGNKCLEENVTTLNVPTKFKDMNCTWESIDDNDSLSSTTAHEITVTRQKNILASIVTCRISDGCNNTSKLASIKLLPDETPESTIKVNIPGGDCLSTTASIFFGPGTVPVTASNPVPGVKFYWETDEIDVRQDYTTQTFNYPIKENEDFIIRLATSGGCKEHYASTTVHRKLDNNIELKVSDSYPVTSTPYTQVTVETVPRLPKMSLQWRYPYSLEARLPDKNRYDQITVYKMTAWKNPINISVSNRYCPDGTISKEITPPNK